MRGKIEDEIKGRTVSYIIAATEFPSTCRRFQNLICAFSVTLLVILPNLKRINKLAVTLEERRAAEEAAEDKWQEIMEEDSKCKTNIRLSNYLVVAVRQIN